MKLILLFVEGTVRIAYCDEKMRTFWYNAKSQEFVKFASKYPIALYEWDMDISLVDLSEFVKNLIESACNIVSSFDGLKPGIYTIDDLKNLNPNTGVPVIHYSIYSNPRFKKKDNGFLYLSLESFDNRIYLDSIKSWCNSNVKLSEKHAVRAKIEFLNLLECGEESKYWSDLASICGLRRNEIKFFQLLQDLDISCSWPEFYVKRAKIRHDHRNIDVVEPNSSDVKVFEEDTYTIDSETTRDFDDAFTVLNYSSDHIEIIVHITDLSCYILDLKSPIFCESFERITSAYFLTGTFHMLPRNLSESCFSLLEGEYRNAIGYHFVLKRGNSVDFKGIFRTRIRVVKNLTYSKADEMMNDGFCGCLFELCEEIKSIRLKNVIHTKFMPELKVNISNEDKIEVSISKRKLLKSNTIITELSVLVNTYGANYMYERSIPVLYKKGNRWDLSPSLNDALGVDMYIQCTSPLRRFIDLITQMQLTSVIDGKSPIFTDDMLKSYSLKIHDRTSEINQIQKKILDHYILLYLSQYPDQLWKVDCITSTSTSSDVHIIDLDYIIPVESKLVSKSIHLVKFINYSPLDHKIQVVQVTQL